MAIELLRRIPDDALPASIRGRADARSAFVVRSILLIPPDMRPIVLLESGNFATSDLNDHYRRVINRSNRLRKLRELNAPPVILHNERRMLQKSVDSLFANTSLPRSGRVLLGSSNRPLKDLLAMSLSHLYQAHSKRCDYSARARAVASGDISSDTVRVPRTIATTLGLPENGLVLLTRDAVASEHAIPVAVLRARPHDAPVIAIHPAHADKLFGAVDGIPECVLHRPLTPQAIDEAERFVGKVVIARHPAGKSWIDNTNRREMAAYLLEAAMQGRPLSFDSPAGVLLAGPGITVFSPVTAPRKREEPTAQMRLPLRGPEIRARMRDLALSLRRKALVFRWGRLDRPPRPGDGTIGLSPWLLEPFEWPRAGEKPLSFVAQLPLDPARRAGVLPDGAFAEAPAGSLLTVFWDMETRQPIPADPNLLQYVPIGPELTRHAYPPGQPPEANALVLVSEVVEEVPAWTELRELFHSEFGDIDPDDFAQFKLDQESLPIASPDTKFGGWGSWVQGRVSRGPLLFQVASDIKVSELAFGDSGILYAALGTGGVELMTPGS